MFWCLTDSPAKKNKTQKAIGYFKKQTVSLPYKLSLQQIQHPSGQHTRRVTDCIDRSYSKIK